VLELKLLLNLCLCCAEDFGPRYKGCNYAPTKKCQRCKRLKKLCSLVLLSAIPSLNSLIRKAAQLKEDPKDPCVTITTKSAPNSIWFSEVHPTLRLSLYCYYSCSHRYLVLGIGPNRNCSITALNYIFKDAHYYYK
jgi:hypothetical protein